MPKALSGTALEVRGVSKTLAASAPVTNASLQIGAGEIHALIGPNGAGQDHPVQSDIRTVPD